MASYTPSLLAYDVFEPDNGVDHSLPPVFFLHGLTASKKYWLDIPQTVADATKRKVYVLDARNHGDTDWTDHFSFEMVAKDVANFMGRHSIRQAAFVGHSMGGAVSINLALYKPELVEKLVVEDMMVRKIPSHLMQMVSGMIQLVQMSVQTIPEGASEDDAFKAIGEFFKNKVPESKMLNKKINLEGVLDLKKGADGRFAFKANMPVLQKCLAEYEGQTKEPEGTFDGPALFIYGTVSEFQIGNEEENIKEHFPQAELLGIEGATHMVHGDNPEEFIEAVINFISS